MSLVAIQGIRGSYSEEAARRIVGDAMILECRDFPGTFEALRSEKAAYAVVPIENKIVGEIDVAVGLLREGGFREHERLSLKVLHVLAGTQDSDIGSVTTVRSHVEALKQCRMYLSGKPTWTQVIGADTASSIRRIALSGDHTAAAIGSRRAAEMYGAKILAEGIADDADNWTTFCLIGR